MSKVLIERMSDAAPLQYSSESKRNPNALGHLAGIGGDLLHETRNGRLYPVELWRKVMNSDDFKEGMATHTIFAETDHPSEESGRIDTSLKEVAAVMTDMEIRENEGILWVEFDILDTPQGRIVKNLVDYGCILGTSSRGIGDEVVKDGRKIIDPDTYQYFCHDLVVMPAVKEARQHVSESFDRVSITESIKKEIENASTESELNSIKRIVEMTEMPELASITEAINIKLESYKSGDNISEKLEDDLGVLAQENEKLRHELEATKSKLSANNIRLGEMRELLKKVRGSSRNLSKSLQESMLEASKLQLEAFDSASQMESLITEYRSSKKRYMDKVNRINEKCHEVMEELSRVSTKSHDMKKSYESKTSEMSAKYESEIAELKSQHEDEVSKLMAENRRIKKHYESAKSEMESKHNSEMSDLISSHESKISDIEHRHSDEVSKLRYKNSMLESQISKLTSDKKLVENRAASDSTNMSRKLDEANKALRSLTSDYIKTRCAQEGISVESLISALPKKYTKDDVDKKLSELSDRKRRLGKMPIAMKPVTVRLEENLNSMSDEDRQMYQILNNAFK